jgi:hypothetical protein
VQAGLPDGIFAYQKSKRRCGQLEYFGIFYEVFGIFCGDLVYFVVIWYILW